MALLFENLANFLATSPEFIENWVSMPVKKKPSIDLPEFAISFFKILPIDHFDRSLKLNRDWYKECRRELEVRRNVCIKRYWDTVEEVKKASKDLDDCWKNEEMVTGSRHNELYNNYCQLADKKYEVVGAWVDVDQAILHCGFPELIDHKDPKYYITMHTWGLDPYEIPSPGNDPEGILDYWGDEDPDA